MEKYAGKGISEQTNKKVVHTRVIPDSTKSIEDDATPWMRLFFSFMNPVYEIGNKETLEMYHLGACARQDEATGLFAKFTAEYKREMEKPEKKRSLWYILWRTVGYGKALTSIMLYTISAAIAYGPILIMNNLVMHFQGTATYSTGAIWLMVSLLFALPIVNSLCYAHSNISMAHMGVQFRNVLVDAIYRKALKLSPAARQVSSTGQIVNMFSNDTKQLETCLFFLLNGLIAPAQIIVCLALIYLQVQDATFVGLGYMILLFPLNGILFGTMNALRRKKVAFTDQRVKLMNEILSGIRIIKYYAWERPFEKKILVLRDEEVWLLTKLAYIVAVGLSLLMLGAPVVQPVLIFYAYVRLGNHLDSAKAFTTLALFNMLSFPFTFLPMGIVQFSQATVSADRILKFLGAEELQSYVVADPAEDGSALSMQGVSMSWMREADVTPPPPPTPPADVVVGAADVDGDSMKEVAPSGASGSDVETATKDDLSEASKQLYEGGSNRSVHSLNNVTFSVPAGALVAIVGPVGSGKSSILNGFLGELILTAGKVRMSGSVAYCDQRPWIINATIRDNILFGLPYEEARFQQALLACSLYDDLAILPGGLLTEIGEKGINLSGGQKARVALARAVYRDADVYLLDDPLSAVDAHVGQWLFSECLVKQLRGKTRLLVTHQVHLLNQCDLVVLVAEGEIKAVGTFEELASREGLDLYEVLGLERPEIDTDENEAGDTFPGDYVAEVAGLPLEGEEEEEEVVVTEPLESTSVAEGTKLAAAADEDKEGEAKGEVKDEGTKIIEVEEKNDGSVDWSTYWFFIKAGGVGLTWLSVFFAIVNQAFALLANFWLSHWGEVSSNADKRGKGLSGEENILYLETFAALSLLAVAAVTCRMITTAQFRVGASTKLHAGLLTATLRAPVAFFDVTPLGRILNRFSSDMLTIDEELSQTINQMVNALMSSLGAVGAIAGATNGTFLVLLFPILLAYGHMQAFFRRSNTAIARLESVSRSPIYADFSQALSGVTTIRAYKDGERFIDTLESRVNVNSVAAIMQQLGSQWLSVRLDVFGALITFFIASLAVLTMDSAFIPPGSLALGLSYSFQLTLFLKFGVRMLATFEAQMNSVERIKYYMDNIVSEEPDPSTLVVPDKDWPPHGSIEGVRVEMRYRDGPLVLKRVDFSVAAQEKVGVAGRTGSGKSSLMVALFRIQELAGGQIFIDGVDCATVPLQLLRSKLGIIPQDPVMFSASVRFNLDPFNEHSDLNIWAVLRDVNMEAHVSSLPGKLEEMVAEGGDNFSAGQRQLICIARALLRKPKILVLDEATASVDNDTDAFIQSMVREKFKDSTVLTIAHRLHTIIDYDKIMVLDSGHVVEMDAPSALLERPRGSFKSLWMKHQSSHGLTKTYSSGSLTGKTAGSSRSLGNNSGRVRLANKETSAKFFDRKMGFVPPASRGLDKAKEDHDHDHDITKDV